MAEDNGYPARVTHQWSSSGLTIVQGGCVHTVKLYKGIVQRKLWIEFSFRILSSIPIFGSPKKLNNFKKLKINLRN